MDNLLAFYLSKATWYASGSIDGYLSFGSKNISCMCDFNRKTFSVNQTYITPKGFIGYYPVASGYLFEGETRELLEIKLQELGAKDLSSEPKTSS